MGVGDPARDFPLLLNGVLTLGTIKEMLQPENWWQMRLPDQVFLAYSNFSEWLQLKQPFSFPSQRKPSQLALIPQRLTSQLARPPFPHLCSLRVCKKSKEHLCHVRPSPTLSLCRSPMEKVAPTYQVFEFCGEAAVVGFFHVHDFCVCAQNVKFPGSESQEKTQLHKSLSGHRTTSNWTEQK